MAGFPEELLTNQNCDHVSPLLIQYIVNKYLHIDFNVSKDTRILENLCLQVTYPVQGLRLATVVN